MTFFLLVFGLSLPFWIVGGLVDGQLLPGVPVSSLMVVCPAIAALILSGRQGGRAAVTRLARRSVDFARIGHPGWYLPTLLLMPAIATTAYLVMRFLKLDVPRPEVAWAGIPALFVMLLVAALAEELGWSGYAVDRMQRRVSAHLTALLIGAVTALWHVVPLLQVGRSPGWTAWQMLNLVAIRVILVWLYNHAGRSVAVVALCHATVNLSWQLFPVAGSHYDPRIVGLITTAVAAVVTRRGATRSPDCLVASPCRASNSATKSG